MELAKHIKLFNRISGPYNWFFHHQVKGYVKIINSQKKIFNDSQSSLILDLGCGTGAFGYSFKTFGFNVIGVDAAFSMLMKARMRGLVTVNANAAAALPFKNKSFDYVTAAFVAHGLDYPLRKKLFLEAARVVRRHVIFHDFHDSRGNIIINAVEWLEGGDYFNFIIDGEQSMKEVFSEVRIIPVAPGNAWYVCTPRL